MYFVFNAKGRIQVTPAGSGAFDVTIDGEEYTQAFDTNVATTIDNFISSHEATIKQVHDIFLVDGTSTLDLQNVGSSVVSSDTATVADKDVDQKQMAEMKDASFAAVTDATITINLNENVAAAADVITVNCKSKDAAQSIAEDLVYKIGEQSSRFTGSPYTVQADHYATFA